MVIGIRAKSEEIMKSAGKEVCNLILNSKNKVIFFEKNFVCDATYGEVLGETEFYEKADAIIVLGGDGTLLKTATKAAEYNVPVLGVNYGRVGLLTDMEKSEIQDIEKLLKNEYVIDERMLITGEIISEDGKKEKLTALNDIVISRGSSPKMIELSLYIDNELTTDIRSDGIILSTPTGSTAYSLSAGGSVIDPKARLIAFTPICPHTLNTKPLIISSDRSVVLKHTGKNGVFTVFCDGQNVMTLSQKCEVNVSVSPKTLKLIRIKNRNFYSVLKEKL